MRGTYVNTQVRLVHFGHDFSTYRQRTSTPPCTLLTRSTAHSRCLYHYQSPYRRSPPCCISPLSISCETSMLALQPSRPLLPGLSCTHPLLTILDSQDQGIVIKFPCLVSCSYPAGVESFPHQSVHLKSGALYLQTRNDRLSLSKLDEDSRLPRPLFVMTMSACCSLHECFRELRSS